MKTRIILLCLGLCLVFCAAAQGSRFAAGDKIFGLTGSGSSNNDFDNTVFGTELSIGYFFKDNFAGEIRQGINLIDVPGNDDDWFASTRGALDWYFGSNSVYPFLGLNLGYIYGDAVNDTFVAGPEGGLKCFVNDTTYIFGMIEYQFFFDNGDELDDAFDDGRFVYTLGIGFKF